MNYDLSLQHQFSPSKGNSKKNNNNNYEQNFKSKSNNQTPQHVPQYTQQNLHPQLVLQPQSPLIKKNVNGLSSANSSCPNSQLTSPVNMGHNQNFNNNCSTPSQSSSNNKTKISPYLQVCEQECISTENIILNNRNCNLHIVVKNTSFVLKIKTNDMSQVNFAACNVKAGLYYASDPLKEVSFIQNPPITYVGSACNNGEVFSIDTKISILSSQHQGNLFYIMVTCVPENNKTQVHTVLSFPIRVVSKVDHIKKDPNGVCEKKQTFIDILTERLNVLENYHVSQSQLITNLLKQKKKGSTSMAHGSSDPNEYSEPELLPGTSSSALSGAFSVSPPSSPFSISGSGSTSNKKQKASSQSKNKNTAERFLECFNRVIKVYKDEGYDKKAPELSDFLETFTEDEKYILVDLLDSFTFDESSQKKQLQQQQSQQQYNGAEQIDDFYGINSTGIQEENCTCESCPYRQQAEQFNLMLSPVMKFQSPMIKSMTPFSTSQFL